MKTRKWIFVAAALVLVVLFALYRHTTSRAINASRVEVNIDNFTFSPLAVHVKLGTQVTWINHDDIPHTVVEDNKAFKSPVLDTDEKFAFTPSKAGTYRYYCSIHPKMTAKLVVE
jgi:plastocyanin